MLIHNKRLHPRRPCEPGEHYHGCMLHEMQEQAKSARSSKSPSRSRTPTSQYSSSSVLSQRRQRNPSTSSSTSNKRYSLGAFPNTYDQINSLFGDVVDSPSKPSLKPVSKSNIKQKSKSTICLNSSLITASETGKPEKRANTVTFKCYDSPDEIIANLFPGIDDEKEPKYLRKGHGAAQMAKIRPMSKDWSIVGRSSSATGNYAANAAAAATAIDNRKTRLYSTSSDNSGSNKDRYRSQTYINGRLYSVERDFDNLGCVF